MKDSHKKQLIDLGQGNVVEHDVWNIVEKIRNYDPNLNVQYADPNVAEVFDAPYRIVEYCKDGITRVVFTCWTLDDRVLDRLYLADTRKVNVIRNIEQQNERAKSETARRYKDRAEIERDIIAHIVDSPKTNYTFPNHKGDIIRVNEDKPSEIIKRNNGDSK